MKQVQQDRFIHIGSGVLLLLVTAGLWYTWRMPDMPPDITEAQQTYAVAVETVTVTITKTDRSMQRTAAAAGQLQTALASTEAQLTQAQATLDDTLATIDTLRTTLRQTVTLAETLTVRVATYVAAVDSMQTSFLAERQTFQAALTAADTVIARQEQALRQKQCRILFVPCPSRKTSAVLGAAVTLVGVVALPRL